MSMYSKIIDLQKLGKAWEHVRKNKPAAGTDRMSAEEFEERKRIELMKLKIELQEGSYRTRPVKLVMLNQGEKCREVALFSMRDKVVQQSLAQELERIYEPCFSDSTWAYRPGHSALQAKDVIEKKTAELKDGYFLKTDIHHFFDEIDQDALCRLLMERVKETEVLDLIRTVISAPCLQEDGSLVNNCRGIYQGSSLAPILSNICLMKNDEKLQKECCFYIRYADDMLFLDSEEARLKKILEELPQELAAFQLKLNETKTAMGKMAEGFSFLGYDHSPFGSSIPKKAVEKLEERLQRMWQEMRSQPLSMRLSKGAEILGGWEQYYRGERKPGGICEYLVLVYMSQRKPEQLETLVKLRKEVENRNAEAADYLIRFWEQNGRKAEMLLEYEQFFALEPIELEEKWSASLLDAFAAAFAEQTQETLLDLMQVYADIGCYRQAQAISEQVKEMQDAHRICYRVAEDAASQLPGENEPAERPNTASESTGITARHLAKLFVGREDCYAEELPIGGSRIRMENVDQPLTELALKEHLEGIRTIGTYVMRNNHTVHFFVFDLDISKKVLVQYGEESPMFQQMRQQAADTAGKLVRLLHQLGISGYVEKSGHRGFHIWIFFQEWISVRYLSALQDMVEEKLMLPDGIQLDCFPDQIQARRLPGPLIRLPFGIHGKTGKRSFFLSIGADGSMVPIADYNQWAEELVMTGMAELKKLAAIHLAKSQNPAGTAEKAKAVLPELTEESFGKLNDAVYQVLFHCKLMRWLCFKAKTSGYLTHGERLSILYVFGHLGEEGKEFVHTIMEYTLNYSYQITQKFILRIPDKPVSCVKLREQYKQVTAEIGCSCNFKRTKNCYPSPVLHAMCKSTDAVSDITMPECRSMTQAVRKTIVEEMNIHQNVQKLVLRILEQKKQQRAIQKSIDKAEAELEKTFDSISEDCLEIEMGMLVRKKKPDGGGYEWMIEV